MGLFKLPAVPLPDEYEGVVTRLLARYRAHFGADGAPQVFCVPSGVVLVGGNTVGDGGRILAAAAEPNFFAVCEPIDVPKAVVMCEKSPEESSFALEGDEKSPVVRACAVLRKKGFSVGGFKAYVSGAKSGDPPEMLVAVIMSSLYNRGRVGLNTIAKATGNMVTGIAAAHGGFITADFKIADSPVTEAVETDITLGGHTLCVVSAVDHCPDDCKKGEVKLNNVAEYFGTAQLRNLSKKDVMLNLGDLRRTFGDDQVLKAIRFFIENEYVDKMSHALREHNSEAYLVWVRDCRENGCICAKLAIAASVVESALLTTGASRVSFNGEIHAYIPRDMLKMFKLDIERVFGMGSVRTAEINPYGACRILV